MDYAKLFAGLPTAYLVMTPDLVIVEANSAYLAATGRSHEDIVGNNVFDAFPPTADALDPSGVPRVQLSFERARDTGLPDAMPLQKYDLVDPDDGSVIERYWSLISAPVLDALGATTLTLQRVEDVTDYVRERNAGLLAQAGAAEREADLYARSLELQQAREAESRSARRLAALADVALRLSYAQTMHDLVGIVIDRGFAALDADGGGIGLRSGENELHLSITDSLGEKAIVDYADVSLDGSLPASQAVLTGAPVLLPDRAASLAFSSEMAEVITTTGCQSWASFPLRTDDATIGSLTVGWAEPHGFPMAEVEVIEALSAQCAYGLERIRSRQAEREAAGAARGMSETLQRSLLTERIQPDHLQIGVRYRPAAHDARIGGDWYDAFLTAEGTTCLVIGDVAGHDRDAAAAMGGVRNMLRGIAYAVTDAPAAVLATLDAAMRDLAVPALATAILARVEQSNAEAALGWRRLSWSNAGHPPPVLISPDGTTRLLSTKADLLLELDPDSDRTDHSHHLAPGSTVLLYTDGLIERRGSHLDAGMDWLLDFTRKLAGLTLEEMCDALLEQVQGFAEDDIALLALRAHPENAARPPEAGGSVLPEDLMVSRGL